MEKNWHAKWICDRQFAELEPLALFHKELAAVEAPVHREDLKNRHMLVRKRFTVGRLPVRAELHISADDYYKVYINGKFVGQGPAPAYHTHYYYNAYPVADFLHEGENIIAVHVYYQGLVNRVWNSGDYRQGLIAELFLDGAPALWTDDTWRYAQAAEFYAMETTGYQTQFLEYIDFRKARKGWRELDFDDTGWDTAAVRRADDHQLFLQEAPPLDVYRIAPQRVEQLSQRHWLIDFGHELTGRLTLTAKGAPGQKLIIRCGEELQPDGKSVRYEMRCGCTYEETLILSGGTDVLEQYDYKGFRYAEVLSDTPHVWDIGAVVRHYPIRKAAVFQSSVPLLNEIWELCKNGVQYGSQEAFLDCPTREKGQYLGDMTITAQVHGYISGDLRLYKKALREFARSAAVCPGLLCCAPGSFMQEIADFSLLYPQQLLTYYWHSGDLELLRELYPYAAGVVAYFRQYEREDGLLADVLEKWNIVDWPENARDGYDFDLSVGKSHGCHNVLNAFYYGALAALDRIREQLELAPEKERAARLKEAYIRAFFRDGLFRDSETTEHASLHSNAIALYFDLVPPDQKQQVVPFIKEKGMRCSVYFAYYLMKGLAKAGEHAYVYQLLTDRGPQSWYNMLAEGGTACFEAWGKEQKWNTSLCHPWASSPVLILIEDIIGLTPAQPGWREWVYRPHIPAELEEITLQFCTAAGVLHYEFNRAAQKLEIKLL